MAASMLEKQTAYWGTDDAMHAAGEVLRLPSRVPTLMVLGSADKNVPQQVTVGVQSWAHRTLVLGNVGHELQNAPPPGASSWVPDVRQFVHSALRESP